MQLTRCTSRAQLAQWFKNECVDTVQPEPLNATTEGPAQATSAPFDYFRYSSPYNFDSDMHAFRLMLWTVAIIAPLSLILLVVLGVIYVLRLLTGV